MPVFISTMNMQLTVIGCASGAPSATKSSSSYLLTAGNNKYLLDCGDGTAASVVRLNIDPNDIDHIFISHMHSDHCMGLLLLVQMMYNRKRTKKLTVHLPREAEDGFKRLFYLAYLFPEKFDFELKFSGLDKDFVFEDENLRMEFFQNSHLYGNKEYIMSRTIPNRMQCFSMIADIGGRKIVYSADVGAISDLEQIVESADLLISEGMHVDLAQLPQLVIETHVKQLMLTHLPDQVDPDTITQEFKKAGFENLIFAKDGLNLFI